MIIRMSDVRAAYMCSGGAREFFRKYGLDWTKFLRDGIPASELAALNDGLADRVIEVARERRQ
jgi:hypothetical protein